MGELEERYDEYVEATCEGREKYKRMIGARDAKIAKCERKIKRLEAEISLHENYNNSSRKAKGFSKKRRNFREEVAERQAKEVAKRQGVGQKRRGHRPGTPGVSHSDKPTFTKKFRPEACGNCGRMDALPYETTYKTVMDNAECGEELCYTEVATSVVCIGCGAVTHPETDSLQGSACGPRRRFLISNMHDAIPAFCVIRKLPRNNHRIKMPIGAISNCLAAIAGFVREDNKPVVTEQHAIAISRSPLPWNNAGGADMGTVWSGLAHPALMERLGGI